MISPQNTSRLIAIVGATATGKSEFAINLATRFDGEIVSADSRQVYRGLDVGTAKITDKEKKRVPHHLIDIIEPDEKLTVAEYKDLADEIIAGIHAREHLPILTGGTGFYIQAVVDDITPPPVPPDPDLRRGLEEKDVSELQKELKERDPDRYNTIQRDNKRRLIRAIEIASHLGSVPRTVKNTDRYDTLLIGLDLPDDLLRDKIALRATKMVECGLIDETLSLLRNNITENKIQELGFEYSLTLSYIRNNISKDELVEKLTAKTWQYAKRQRIWFKRDKRIEWFKPEEQEAIETKVSHWI